MPKLTNVEGIFNRQDWVEIVTPFLVRCRPRLLIVTDGLSYLEGDGFGLSRFLHAITAHSSVSLTPTITLAHRSFSASPVAVYGVNYPVLSNFNFATAVTAVSVQNYDQIWMFGFDSTQPGLNDPQVAVIADFMNAGGGVFSTGDHAALGKAMGGRLPRIRHMREWTNIPMGSEALPGVRQRIDSIVNAGSNSLYEFADQSDAIPQRIYPNYAVTGPTPGWSATIHPLLRMPGAPINRSTSADFTNDMDVMPDHPHESVCYEVSTTVNAVALNGSYVEAGRNFQEFPFAQGSTTVRIGSGIVAYAVSGGRSVLNGIWKPPVNPRMYGILAAFDGHLATSYTGNSVRPGRIVVDSTWHHYVNINLDGTSSGRNGLGLGIGAGFVPSPDLLKIYRLYQNTVDWLQPLNRIWCKWWIDLLTVRFDTLLFEELHSLPKQKSPEELMGIGAEAALILQKRRGPFAANDLVMTALRLHSKTSALADSIAINGIADVQNKLEMVVALALGQAIADLAVQFPDDNPVKAAELLKDGHEKLELSVLNSVAEGALVGIEIQMKRASAQLARLKSLRAAAKG